ncbi:sensor histidine kinase [Roseateles albus]|uniref:histidine kinase n=1 Tax=Roseateles albus TaxID=2987525 RepID=A0ABT5KKQ9_9BURK|nr:ATP-binding protein [Roseateles albus]MDC8774534.1 ATP-binding protein [Roseateles albus]
MVKPIRLIAAAALGTLLLPALLLAQPTQAPALGPSGLSAIISTWLMAMLMMMGVTTGLLARLCPADRRLPYLSGMMLSAVAWAMLLEFRPGLAGAEMGLLALLTFCALRFVLRPLLGLPAWLASALRVQLVLAPLTVGLLGDTQLPWLAQCWFAALALELLLAVVYYLRSHSSDAEPVVEPLLPQLNDPLLLRALLSLLALSASALMLMQVAPAWSMGGDALAATPPSISLLLLWGMALLLMALGLQTLAALARARRLAEIRHAQAEQDMHARVAEVELSFGALVEQKLEQVTERERKRIAADLHDDLGAKLLTIVHTSESDRISTLAREALEEMRLSVRGLTGKPVQLLDALGDWRAELVSRLGQANILAEWESPTEDIVHTLPARAYVQTTRIFREAVSNIIKHSGGTHCNISCKVQDGDFLVVIQDNGQGIPAELDGRLDRGHGMASMKSRAKQMHGQCLVESGPGWGTVIRLTIPL